MDILRAAQREVQHPGANRAVGDLVDQDEAAQRAVVGIGLEHDRLVGRQFGHADRVEFQRLGRKMLHRVDVDRVFGLLDGAETVCVPSFSQ
jgi:hypothetical protein